MSNLTSVITEFFLAGMDTTSSTLAWGMLYMILNPRIQDKVQKELDEVTGCQRLPNIQDRQKTPYVEAVIHECQRLANVVPSVCHATSTSGSGNLDNGKYLIPAGTRVNCNFAAVMMDPENFPNPEKFDPERYLTPEGYFHLHPKVIPFGIGKRRCIGMLYCMLISHNGWYKK